MTRAEMEWSLYKRTQYPHNQWHPDKGANDEGYHWKHCQTCRRRQEHELNSCLTCGGHSRR